MKQSAIFYAAKRFVLSFRFIRRKNCLAPWEFWKVKRRKTSLLIAFCKQNAIFATSKIKTFLRNR